MDLVMAGSHAAEEAKCTCLGRFVKGEWVLNVNDPACFWHGNTTENTPRYEGQTPEGNA